MFVFISRTHTAARLSALDGSCTDVKVTKAKVEVETEPIDTAPLVL